MKDLYLQLQSINILIQVLQISMKSIAYKFSMIFFRGKMTCSPNTLNNEIHTYFYAHYWQQKYQQELFDKQKQNKDEDQKSITKTQKQNLPHSYQNWMKLIKNVAKFNRFYVQCYKNQYPNDPVPINIMDFRAFRLFHDWDVWGDSTSYPELKATAFFDSNDPNPLKSIDSEIYLTSKMGGNKCVIANQDTDSQDMSKLFGFSINMNQQLKFVSDPSVTRQLHFRTVDGLPWTPSMGVQWFTNGRISLLDKKIKKSFFSNQFLNENNEGWAEMRMLQYRYNHPTKVSSVAGYIMKTEDNKCGNLSFVNKYWRIVNCNAQYDNPSPFKKYNGTTNKSSDIQIFLQQVEYGPPNSKRTGILLDLSGAIFDANTGDPENLLPLLPTQINLKMSFQKSKNIIIKIISLNEVLDIFHKFGGMYLLPNSNLPPNERIHISLATKIPSEAYKTQVIAYFEGSQNHFNLQIKDRFKKTKQVPQNERIKQKNEDISGKSSVVTYFQKYITYDLYLTQFGKPFTGTLQFTLDTSYNIDTSGITQYTSNSQYLDYLYKNKKVPQPLKPPQQRIQSLLKDSCAFSTEYKSLQQINQSVFQSKLIDQIIPHTNNLVSQLFYKQDSQKYQLRYSFQDNGVQRQFKLSFQQEKQVFKKSITFQNGYPVDPVKIYLNKNLTKNNNPRKILQSLCLLGTLKYQIPAFVSVSQTFTGIYYQNPQKDPFQDIDWLNVVGPKLKLMGLMYPSMQNIIDLYDYDGLSMNAMKRAFQIENQNHSRYMPATRQMSSVTHRQIRRWLYNPVYDAQIHLDSYTPNFSSTNYLPFTDFKEGKKQLIDLVKQAFKLELTTIPLYLSALYSLNEQGEAANLIRSVAKDEMKHLFIVSNLLNALGENPPYPIPGSSDNNFIPTFPINASKDLICFHFQSQQEINKKWKTWMDKIQIQTIAENLLKFIMIQMPAEAYQIQINPLLMTSNKKYVDIQQSQNQQYKSLFGQQYEMLIERSNRIWNIFEAARAVANQQKLKRSNRKSSSQFLTIGMAYQKIMDYLWVLSDMDHKQLFNGNTAKQFTYMYLPYMDQIINLRTALQQIRNIVEQGEGSSLFSVTGQPNTTSHFVKFIEIYTGCDLKIESVYYTKQEIGEKTFIRKAKFKFIPNQSRFPNFPNYTSVAWNEKTDKSVDQKVNKQLQYERFSDQLKYTKFPNIYAPRSFLNGYNKILEELGFIFRTDPSSYEGRDGESFPAARLRKMQNTIAKMRQMTLNADHIVNPNDTFDQANPTKPANPPVCVRKQELPKYQSASPKYNINESSYLPPPIDPQRKPK